MYKLIPIIKCLVLNEKYYNIIPYLLNPLGSNLD